MGDPQDYRLKVELAQTQSVLKLRSKMYENQIARQQQTIDRLRAALAEIREIYAGMEGPIIPETAPEAYLQRIIESMWKAAREALLQEAADD